MQAESLSEFYEVCKGLELARNFQFPVLAQVCEPYETFSVKLDGNRFVFVRYYQTVWKLSLMHVLNYIDSLHFNL
jgi:hypothetical protein